MAADLEISVGIDARQTKTGAAEAKSAVKGVGDEVEKTGKKAKSVADRDFKELERAMKSASIQGSAMGELIGRAFDYVVRGAVQVAKAIYGMAQGFADAGVEIYKAQQITQLSAETLSAIAMQARRTGISMNEVGESFKEFTRLIGEANNQSKEALAKMTRLGIDPVKAAQNLEGAYRQVLARIVSLKNPVDQANAAIDAFGESGYKLIPFIKSFDGDLDKLLKTARDFGVVMSTEDVRAAREFDRAMKDLWEIILGVTRLFGKAFLPILQEWAVKAQLWFRSNRDDVETWAKSIANAVKGVITWFEEINQWMDKHPMLVRFVYALTGATHMAASQMFGYFEQKGAGRPTSNYDPSLNTIPDLTRTPPTSTYFRGGSVAGRTAGAGSAAKPELTDEQKQAQDLQRIIKDLRAEIAFFGQDTEEASLKQKFFEVALLGTNKALFDLALGFARASDAQKAKKQLDDEALAAKKAYDERVKGLGDDITQSTFADRNSSAQRMWEIRQRIDLGRELNEVEMIEIQIARELVEFAEKAKTLNEPELKLLRERLAARHAGLRADAEHIDNLNKEEAAQKRLQSVMGGLDEDYARLTAELLEYTTGVKATAVAVLELSEAYKKMTPQEQAKAKAGAERNDRVQATLNAAREATRQYDEFRNTILDGLQAMEGGAGSFFSWMYNRFKRFLQEMVAEWIASKFFKMFFGGGNQQAGAAAGGGGGGFLNGIGNVFGQIFGGGRQQGGGGTGVFNPGYFNASGSGGGAGTIPGPDLSNMINTIGLRGGGTASAGGGGLFGSQGFGFNKGTMTGIGGLLSIAGGLIPGRVGSTLSMAGTGLAIGSMVGGPLGGLIGAGIGGLIGIFSSLFGRNKQRKKDEATRTQGMIDALNELKKFDDLIRDVRTLRIDPDSGISQGTQLGETVRSNYLQMANSLKDKKTRNIALGEVTRIDTIIAQKMSELRGVAEVSRAAGERERRILPEFAGGVYMSPAFQNFRRYNGMLGGAWTGRDTLPAMLAAGEMVLNPMQQNRVRAAAGFDVFKPAGIPGYADGGMAGGGGVMGPMNVTIVVEQDFQGMWRATAESDMGQMVTAKVVEKKYENDEIRLKRRGQ